MELHLAAHRAYLDKFYNAGSLVASGPREPITGGVILCNVRTLEEARNIISQDPFFKEDIADYEITQKKLQGSIKNSTIIFFRIKSNQFLIAGFRPCKTV